MKRSSLRVAHRAAKTPPASDQVPSSQLQRWANGLFLAWLYVYMEAQGTDGYFARTADRVDTLWVQLVFLDVPLQLTLAFVTALTLGAKDAGVRRLGLAAALINAVLILGHVALSVATA